MKRLLPLVAVLALLGGCAADPAVTTAAPPIDAPTPSPSTSTDATDAPASTPSPSPAETEAGSYEAVLAAPVVQDGLTTVDLMNVGGRADHYTIEVRPAANGTVTPDTVDLAPGASITLNLQITESATLTVISAGLTAEVAEVNVAPS